MYFLPKRIVVAPVITAPAVHVAPVHPATAAFGVEVPLMWQYTQFPGTATQSSQTVYPQAVYSPPIQHFPSVYIQNLAGTLSF